MFEQMKLMMPRLESMFLMAKAASLGIVGETLMIPSATSRIESTRASNSMLFRSGVESRSATTRALK